MAKTKIDHELAVVRDLLRGPNGKDLWDVLVALRGPDHPSERHDNMGTAKGKADYKARVAKKMETVAVIRGATFPGIGGARWVQRSYVTLPPSSEWDHFDKHVAQAAEILGLEIRTAKLPKPKNEVVATIKEPSVLDPNAAWPAWKALVGLGSKTSQSLVVVGLEYLYGPTVTMWPEQARLYRDYLLFEPSLSAKKKASASPLFHEVTQEILKILGNAPTQASNIVEVDKDIDDDDDIPF